MGAIRPVSSVQAALAAAEAAGYQGSVQAAQAAAEPAGHAEFCRASLQAAPAAPEAAQGSAQLLPTPLSLGVIRRLAVRPERARWWRRLLRRSAHLQARRVVRVEAQDARAAAAAALRPAARGRPARRAAARHRAARFGGGRASGTLGQHAAGGPGARLPLTSLRARRHSSVNCAEIEQRRARRRRVQQALPLAAQLPLRCGGRVG